MQITNYDVLIIGAGPGGYVAAIRAAQLNLKTAIIEKKHLGGVCLNSGCIPTKSLLKSAEILLQTNYAQEYGIKFTDVNIDLEKMISHARNISSQLTSGIRSLLKKYNIEIIDGNAKLAGNNSVLVESECKKMTLKARNIIVATGARARILDKFENNPNIWTYKEALNPNRIPKSMTIIGSGAIGVEFASFYNAIGTKVTILESRENILPAEDVEISKIAKKILESKNIRSYSSAKLNGSYIENGDGLTISFNHKNEKELKITSEILLLAIGIVPNSGDIGIENTKAKLSDTGHIVTNDYMETCEPNLYAIGDVTSGPWLAHKASHEGILAVEKIANMKISAINRLNIPRCVYSIPQIASIGLTEEEAVKNHNIKIGRFPFYANGKALIASDKDGLVKTIFDSNTGELLGMHMIGNNVTELIHSAMVHKFLEGTEEDFFKMVFPHPTLSEMIHESALNAFGISIHI